MFEFHQDRKRYFDIQIINTENHVIPFIEERFAIAPGMRVLEIGCGEAGVLKAFVNKGCTGIGVEFDHTRIDNANIWLHDDIVAGNIKLITKDIYITTPEEIGKFHIIVLKDVIEHIHNQEKLIGWLQTFLHTKGIVYFGFPPWQMPFGGHQQICRGKFTSRMPYYHLLPKGLYKAILKRSNEPVEELLEIKETGISIEKFERIVKRTKYNVLHKKFFLINPIYEWKFGWKARKQFPVIAKLPVIRNFLTTCVYYIISPQ